MVHHQRAQLNQLDLVIQEDYQVTMMIALLVVQIRLWPNRQFQHQTSQVCLYHNNQATLGMCKFSDLKSYLNKKINIF